MTPMKWAVLATFFGGFAFPALWVVCFVLFEFGVGHGTTVTALWVEGLIRRRGRD